MLDRTNASHLPERVAMLEAQVAELIAASVEVRDDLAHPQAHDDDDTALTCIKRLIERLTRRAARAEFTDRQFVADEEDSGVEVLLLLRVFDLDDELWRRTVLRVIVRDSNTKTELARASVGAPGSCDEASDVLIAGAQAWLDVRDQLQRALTITRSLNNIIEENAASDEDEDE